ncbi:hypothetical protein IE53DRAFT_410884 [Violaceomyces palustris]|uniref:Uncharacterized protein n=1 Tax=Violaceomyces palustris TaxID=1673888 RepID=A0ACD0NXJ5_9BASI|nr:hypothetical protein IE53DRAFT_410884 [Violaceomyces palustris]
MSAVHPNQEATTVENGNGYSNEKSAENGGGHLNGGGSLKQGNSGYYGYQGGPLITKTLTPGGHLADDDLIAIGNSHRKIANPLPLGVFAFSTTTLLLSLYNIEIDGIEIPNAVLGFALFHGGFVQYLAGLWEYASGNTLGATIFVSYGCFWWGYAMLLIPFFGFVGEYNGAPGIWATGSPFASQASDSIGLFLWTWFGITTVFLICSIRASGALVSLLFFLWLTRDWLKSQTQEKLEQVSKMQEEEMAEEGGKGVTEAKALDLEEKRKFKPRVDTPIPTQILYGLGVAAAMFGSYELLKLAWAYASKKRNESVESQYETKMGLPPGSLKKQGYFK